MKTVILLIISNIFMTLAWYGHLKFKELKWFENAGLITIVLISWGLALFEYCFQVPANRIGSDMFSLTQLKIIQESVTLVVFTVIAYLLFGETLKWNNLVSYALLVGAVFFAFM